MEKVSPSELNSLWKQALAPLEEQLPSDDFETWIRPLSPLAMGEGVLEISVPNRMFASWVEENFADKLAAAWVEASGRTAAFRFSWDHDPHQGELFPGSAIDSSQTEMFAVGSTVQRSRATTPATEAARSAGLIERYGFSRFVVGPNNQFARAAAIAVAGQPGTLYNPFFIFGGVGLGKTHVANAIGLSLLEKNPSTRVLFLSADTFTNRLIDAIARNKAPEFKNRMRKVDCLIIDDVQFLAGRERTQEEFFHIFNTLYDSGRQIVLTSDKFPHELQGVEERLCNRFGWGLVADIQTPDAETRSAILERKAREEGIKLPYPVASFMAERFENNIRELEGALTRLSAWASLNRCEISLDLAKQILGELSAEPAEAPTLEQIDARVVNHFGLRPGDLQARKRTRKVAEARHIAMHLMRHMVGASFPQIGSYLGGRDHSTVVHGCQAVEKRCKGDARFRSVVDTISRSLGCG